MACIVMASGTLDVHAPGKYGYGPCSNGLYSYGLHSYGLADQANAEAQLTKESVDDGTDVDIVIDDGEWGVDSLGIIRKLMQVPHRVATSATSTLVGFRDDQWQLYRQDGTR